MSATTQPTVQTPAISIYGLVDPRTTELRYVGKAKNPQRRLTLHLCPTQLRSKTHKNHWIKSLLAENARPELFVFEAVPETEWEEAERFWIAYMKFLGCRLTNSTDGGDTGAKEFPPEVRWRCGSSRRGKKFAFSETHRAKIAAANRARAKNPDWLKRARENLSAHRNVVGHPWTDSSRRKMSETQRKKFSLMTPKDRVEFSMKGVAARQKRRGLQ